MDNDSILKTVVSPDHALLYPEFLRAMDAAREDEAGKWEAERERMVRDAAFGKDLALEFGYKQCEKGNNLEAAMLNYKKLIV